MVPAQIQIYTSCLNLSPTSGHPGPHREDLLSAQANAIYRFLMNSKPCYGSRGSELLAKMKTPDGTKGGVAVDE